MNPRYARAKMQLELLRNEFQSGSVSWVARGEVSILANQDLVPEA